MHDKGGGATRPPVGDAQARLQRAQRAPEALHAADRRAQAAAYFENLQILAG